MSSVAIYNCINKNYLNIHKIIDQKKQRENFYFKMLRLHLSMH